jgi:DNA-binding NarL/FixJ family response regulator
MDVQGRTRTCGGQPERIRVVIVDDHCAVRESLALVLGTATDIEVIGQAGDGVEAIACANATCPDVMLMDLSMPTMNGLAATSALRTSSPDVGVVVLSRHSDPAYVRAVLRAGAAGYVLKRSSPGQLHQAIRAVHAGQRYLDHALAQDGDMAASWDPSDQRLVLTAREAAVLQECARGYSNAEIAVRFGLSIKTVESHKGNATRKLGAHGGNDIMRFALLCGWLAEAERDSGQAVPAVLTDEAPAAAAVARVARSPQSPSTSHRWSSRRSDAPERHPQPVGASARQGWSGLR